MLKMISGLLAHIVGAGSPPPTHEAPHHGHWLRHSRARAVLGRCACRECHLVRKTRRAPSMATRAVAKCLTRMEALRERVRRDDVIHDVGPVGPPGGDAIDWDGLEERCESECPECAEAQPRQDPDRGSDGSKFKICTACETQNLKDDGSCAKCEVIARRKRLGIQKGQCTDCRGPLPYGEEIGMCRPCAEAIWGDR